VSSTGFLSFDAVGLVLLVSLSQVLNYTTKLN